MCLEAILLDQASEGEGGGRARVVVEFVGYSAVFLFFFSGNLIAFFMRAPHEGRCNYYSLRVAILCNFLLIHCIS